MKLDLPKRDYWPNKAWRTLQPAEAGLDIQRLASLDDAITSSYKNINGILIVRNGYNVFERYYSGSTPEDTHNVASVTKSITSALTGIAIDKGFIEHVDQKVLDFFPEYKPAASEIKKRTITLRHLLTMTAPFAWKTTDRRGFEPLDRMRRQKDWVTYALDLMGKSGQPDVFQYCTAGAHLLSAILTRATGKNAREFANEHLFHPIGMRGIPHHKMDSFHRDDVFGKKVRGWVTDPSGHSAGGWGLTLSLRDMARFGFLYLNQGKWENNEVISSAWVEASTKMNANGYGYMLWLRNEGNLFAFAALGAGGNVICCIPAMDLVIAITSRIVAKPRDLWSLIEKHMLSAFIE